jgi:hypothetical protein
VPKLKPNELENYRGAAVARNAGPSRQNVNNAKIESKRADKVMLPHPKKGK